MRRLHRGTLAFVTLLGVALVVYLYRNMLPAGAKRCRLSFGRERSYVLYAGRAEKKTALVVVLHGLNDNGVRIERRTQRGFDALSDREGIVVVYPDAVTGRWSEGWPRGENVDDIGFLSMLVDAVATEFDIDRRHVYAAGLSNGASMVYRFACERENQVAAIAAVAGAMAVPLAARCRDGRPVPILVMHGTNDSI